MKRFFATTLFALAASTWTSSIAMSDELPKPESNHSSLSIHTQQTSTQNSGSTQKLAQVVIEGNGSTGNFADLSAEIQKQLLASGLSQEVQADALKAIMDKLEDATKEVTGWSGRVVWTSNVPGETTVVYEPVLSQPPKLSDPSIIEQQVGRILNEVAGRLQMPEEQLRLRGNANRLAERANRWHLERINAQQQAKNGAIEPRYRIGIDCQSVSADSNPPNEKGDVQNGSNSSPGVFEVLSVVKDSPAELAGLKPGDQVGLIDGEKMTSVEQLIEAVQKSGKERKKLALEVVRNEEHIEFQIEPVIMAELNLENMQQAFPFGPDAIPFPEGVPASGLPGWIMNRQELNEFRRNDGNNLAAPTEIALAKQISDLQKEIAELKAMVTSLLNK